MELKEAMKMSDEFPLWVKDFLKKSAREAAADIRWFIKTLYKEGYEIIKKPGDEDIDETIKGM